MIKRDVFGTRCSSNLCNYNCNNDLHQGSFHINYTHLFNGPLSRTTRVSQYQKGKTNLDFAEATDSDWQWHQLGNMQVCTSLQHPTTQFFTGRMPFLPPN